jgi:ribonuclease III
MTRKRAAPAAPTAADADGSVERSEALARSLGLTFRDPALLRLALTHRSVAHDARVADPIHAEGPATRSNERLEFLGDAVLGYLVAADLYNRHPDAPEGDLTARRVALVRGERLVSWARSIALGDYLYLATSEKISDSNRDRILSGAFEALIGAIALDGGVEAAAGFVSRFLDQDAEGALDAGWAANPKGRLQEIVQERYREPPVYQIIDETGPDHARTFTAEVMVNGRSAGIGVGESKRLAEQDAAGWALERLGVQSGSQQVASVRKRRKPARVKGSAEHNG